MFGCNRSTAGLVTTTMAIALMVMINLGNAVTYTVTTTSDSGTGSLRWAITQANGNPGTDTITFNILGAGPHTIQPFSALPTIGNPVIIDGFTQTGATPNTNPIDQPCNAVLKIELDGTSAGSGADGLRIASGSSTVKGLVINRFDGVGVALAIGGGNLIEGCIIGMDPGGTVSLGNYDGIELTDGSNGSTIGGTAPSARNIVSGNNRYGIQIVQGASGNAVLGNFVGTDVAGTLDRGNLWAGVYLWTNTANNTVGGTASGARNVISGNDWDGVRIQETGGGNVVLGNYIGTDRTGASALGNAWSGIRMEDAANNTVGGTTPGAGNVIAANGWDGVGMSGTGSVGNQVLGNYIGTNVSGTDTLGNADEGIRIHDGASNNTVGGTTAGACNVISGNCDHGVAIDGGGGPTTGNVVQGNHIGTNATGTQALGNLGSGVDIWIASGNTVGGTTVGARNVISGNHEYGAMIDGAGGPATGNVIQGNYIGTDATGAVALGNLDGVRISGASGNTVGGATPGIGNTISGNRQFGVSIGYASGNVLQGNYIGTDATGTVALGVQSVGVSLWAAPGNIIGGAGESEANVVSGNNGYGFYIAAGADSNRVVGNYIGVDGSGAGNIGNALQGVYIEDSGWSAIGGTGTGEGNVIAFNCDDGVWIASGVGNAVLGNAIFSNDSLGIDLGSSGVTPNDPGDSDTGANLLQNSPLLATAQKTATTIAISGSLNSTPNMGFRLEFFANDTADGTLHGEGRVLIGTRSVTTNTSGDAAFRISFDIEVPSGSFISATATDADGNTSEFSEVIMVMGLTGEVEEGELVMEWEVVEGTEEYWIYGAENNPNFIPGLTRQYEYRLDVVSSSTTTWSSANGVDNPASNWTYLVIAVDAEEEELNRSNRCGECDFGMVCAPY